MSLAAATRDAVREHPFLHTALRAGVVNYSAAAAFLDVGTAEADGEAAEADGEAGTEAVAAALRRFAEDLPPYAEGARDVSVRMRSGVGLADDPDVSDGEALLTVGGASVLAGGGDLTAILATGGVDAATLAAVLGRLRTANVLVDAAAVAGGALVVVVPRREGATALRLVESAATAVVDG